MEPGIVNVLLDGRFQDVYLHDASDSVLDKLYEEGLPYIQLTPEGVIEKKPDSPKIVVSEPGKGKNKNKKPYRR